MFALVLSYALDTNGGNHRFAKAAERFGADPDVLKALALGNTDPAGVVSRFQMAADKFGALSIRSAHRAEQYFAFPNDLRWTRQTEPELRVLVKQADVIHLNNSYMAAQRFRIQKPMLLHHHGSMFRNDPDKMFAIAKHYRMTQAVSTIDLQKPDPSILHWLPTAYNVDELAAFGESHRREDDGKVRIVHAPTNRMLKHTDLLIAAVKLLESEGLPVELVLVEGKTWAECMAVKATADILFDQLLFGYGCNSVEAWSMGIPVISGADDWTLDRMLDQWGDIPFYLANEKTLADRLRQMVKSKNLRAEWAGRGMKHVRRFHDEKPALTILADLYAKTISHYNRIRIPTKAANAVTFRNPRNIKVYTLAGLQVDFVNGMVQSDDPIVIERLRTVAKSRPGLGIEEVA